MRVRVTTRQLDRTLVVMAGLLVLLSLVLFVRGLGDFSAPVWVLLAAFAVTIAVGDVWRVSILGSRRFAPVALAASLAWAMTTDLPGVPSMDHHAAVVLLGTALAGWVGHAVHSRVTGEKLLVRELALRVVVVAVAAVLFRVVPLGGDTLLQRVVEWEDERWRVAVVMLAVAACALSVQLAAMSLQRAARDHALVWRSVVEEVGAVAPLALATTATAAVVALALGSLGPVAVPLFMVPLVLLQLAVGQQATIREAQLQTIRALSRLTEQGGFTPHGHAARVARLAVPMGRVIGLAERDLLDLEYAALLHDLGQVSLRRPIPGGATVQTSTVDQRRIAGVGAAILARTAELSRLSPVIADQATPYRRSAEIGQIPIGSRILKVANAFDDLVGAQVSPVAAQRALRRIRLGTGYEYDPMVVRALCSVLEREGQMSSRDLARLDI